jgi:large subunit ribosomal protein L1
LPQRDRPRANGSDLTAAALTGERSENLPQFSKRFRALREKIKGGTMDCDVALATPDMMGVVGPLGRVLGPRGLMPSPRSGTVTTDIASAVREFKAGKIEFRNDKGGNVAVPVGKINFSEEQLIENITAFLNYLKTLKPAAAKGTYLQSVTVSATMSPGIRITA